MIRETLDIDTNDKETVKRILTKIVSCPYLFDFDIKHSSSKGVHIILFCFIKCCKCRLVFDDPRRFEYDQFRPEYARNILFDEKVFLWQTKRK